ncbi:hypothetical protein [Lacticaseibacillus paracasei]|uniref:hypothetical protein n=1 Tax=Lacticaseibacillus paracasei TaxID=1597 RepID=UPI0031F57ED7
MKVALLRDETISQSAGAIAVMLCRRAEVSKAIKNGQDQVTNLDAILYFGPSNGVIKQPNAK